MKPSGTKRALLCALLLVGVGCTHDQSASRETQEQPRAHEQHEHGRHHGGMQHRFEDAEAWARHFDDPERDAWQKPDEVVSALELGEDAKVADLGSGTGYFAVRLARAVPGGKVYGVDIEPDMTRYLEERARREGLGNLEAVQGEAEDPKLPEAVDLVLIVDTYHHLGDRVDYMRRLGEKLRPGGRVAIVDFRKDSPRGPRAEHKLTAEQVEEEMKEAGYRLAKAHDFLPDQYFLEFERS